MENFKVICKLTSDRIWVKTPIRTKVVTTKKMLGLISKTEIVKDPEYNSGPKHDEICIVYEEYDSKGDHYYKLLGYPFGGYLSKHFIKLDEFTETEKEIAKKSEPSLN